MNGIPLEQGFLGDGESPNNRMVLALLGGSSLENYLWPAVETSQIFFYTFTRSQLKKVFLTLTHERPLRRHCHGI